MKKCGIELKKTCFKEIGKDLTLKVDNKDK